MKEGFMEEIQLEGRKQLGKEDTYDFAIIVNHTPLLS